MCRSVPVGFLSVLKCSRMFFPLALCETWKTNSKVKICDGSGGSGTSRSCVARTSSAGEMPLRSTQMMGQQQQQQQFNFKKEEKDHSKNQKTNCVKRGMFSGEGFVVMGIRSIVVLKTGLVWALFTVTWKCDELRFQKSSQKKRDLWSLMTMAFHQRFHSTICRFPLCVTYLWMNT